MTLVNIIEWNCRAIIGDKIPLFEYFEFNDIRWDSVNSFLLCAKTINVENMFN